MATSPTEPACRLPWRQPGRRCQPRSGHFADSMKMCRGRPCHPGKALWFLVAIWLKQTLSWKGQMETTQTARQALSAKTHARQCPPRGASSMLLRLRRTATNWGTTGVPRWSSTAERGGSKFTCTEGNALHTCSQRAAGRCRSYPTELGLLPAACCMRRQEVAAGQLRRESAIYLLGPRCHCRSFCRAFSVRRQQPLEAQHSKGQHRGGRQHHGAARSQGALMYTRIITIVVVGGGFRVCIHTQLDIAGHKHLCYHFVFSQSMPV